jgi:tetratricopeptide (TPR) repeat protein
MITTRAAKVVLLALGATFMLSPRVFAQTAKVDVTVQDADGKTVPGAKVSLTPAKPDWTPREDGTVMRGETNGKGIAVFGFAKPGDYVVECEGGTGKQVVKASVKVRDAEHKQVIANGKTIEDTEGAIPAGRPVVPLSIPADAKTVAIALTLGAPPVAQGGQSTAPGSVDVKDRQLKEQLKTAVQAIQSNQLDAGLAKVDELLQKRGEMSPDDLASVLYMRAFCLYQLKREQEAEAPAREALQLRPGMTPAMDLLVPMLMHQKRYPEASQLLAADLQQTQDPQRRSPLLLNLAVALREQNRDQEALAPLEEAHRTAPEDANISAQLADLYTVLGRTADADQLLGPNLPPAQAAALRFNMAASLMKSKKWPEAEAQFRRALEMDPHLAEAHRYLAETLIRQGKRQEAVAELEAYLAAAPDAPDAATVREDIKNMKVDLGQAAAPRPAKPH